MLKPLHQTLLVLSLILSITPVALAQQAEPAEDDEGSSKQVEQRDDAFRRQMELEDARSKDRTYVDTTYTEKIDQEKIDKLPEESRDNIRDQLVDVIVENGEWEPKDALEEYPYVPTAAAQGDSELEQQEQEAWEEQIEKYHEREAAAFGSHRGPVPGPGNPNGQQGGQKGDGGEQGQQGGQQGGGQDGSGENGEDSRGTYQPGKSGSSGSEDEISTEGVSESALDFLTGGQGRQQPTPQGSQEQAQASEQAQAQEQAQASEQAQAQEQAQASEQAQAQEQAQAESREQSESESEQQESTPEIIELDTRGIIAIQDLNKLEGTVVPAEPEEPEDP